MAYEFLPSNSFLILKFYTGLAFADRHVLSDLGILTELPRAAQTMPMAITEPWRAFGISSNFKAKIVLKKSVEYVFSECSGFSQQNRRLDCWQIVLAEYDKKFIGG